MALGTTDRSSGESFLQLGREREGNGKPVSEQYPRISGNYMEEKDGWAARGIRTWMLRGGRLYSFFCREDTVRQVADALTVYGLPFAITRLENGKTGFLVRQRDVPEIRKLTSQVRRSMPEPCRITTGQKAQEACLKTPGKDKMMLQIRGLSREEVFCLEEDLSQALPGSAAGIDRMPDGTYTVTCRGKEAADNGFWRALAKAVVFAGGSMARETTEKAKKEDRFRRIRYFRESPAEGTRGSCVWIVGKGDRFVRWAGDGFEAGHAGFEEGEVFLVTDLKVKKGDPDFDRRLGSSLSCMTGHICMETEEEVLEYFRKRQESFINREGSGYRLLMEQAGTIVETKLKDSRVFAEEKNWKGKTVLYEQEMARILRAAADGRIPGGYAKEDVLLLRRTIKEFGLDTASLRPALDKLAGIEVCEKEAELRRISGIHELIRGYREKAAQDRAADISREGRKPARGRKGGTERGT